MLWERSDGSLLAAIVDHLSPLGYKLYAADQAVKEHLESSTKDSTSVEVVEFPVTDKRALRDVFKKYDIRCVFNLASARGKDVHDQDYVMRRNAVDFGVPLFMEPKVSLLLVFFFLVVHICWRSQLTLLPPDCATLRPMHERALAEEGGRPAGGEEVERVHGKVHGERDGSRSMRACPKGSLQGPYILLGRSQTQ